MLPQQKTETVLSLSREDALVLIESLLGITVQQQPQAENTDRLVLVDDTTGALIAEVRS